MQEAIKKLRDEMAANTDDEYTQAIGNFLIRHLESNPSAAEKILVADKSISKSLDTMAAEAKKKAKNGRAMLTEAQGYGVVLKYFGIEVAPVVPSAPAAAVPVAAAPAPEPTPASAPAVPSNDFKVSLDDFIS